MIRRIPRSALVADIVIASVLFVVLTPLGFAVSTQFWVLGFMVDTTAFQSVSLILTSMLMCGGVAIVRLSPGLALLLVWAGALIQMLGALAPLPVNLTILVVLFGTAAWGTLRVFWLGLASAGVGALTAALYLGLGGGTLVPGGDVRATVLIVALFGAVAILALGLSWVSGLLWRTVLRARSTRVAQQDAERQAAEEQERVRIARDMHDVVAHSLAVVIAQADGARYAASADPEAARTALETISATSRAALSDVRMLLTQLRHRQGALPQPTLADIETLFAQVRQAGIEPQVTIDPAPASAPPAAVQLAVYRILQEALTNAIRHGEGDAEVHLAWHPHAVTIVVRNTARAGAVATPGHGLIGMRERAQLVGGTLDTELAGTTFIVRATIPLAGVTT